MRDNNKQLMHKVLKNAKIIKIEPYKLQIEKTNINLIVMKILPSMSDDL